MYPVLAEETSDLMRRIEPILTPDKLVSRYLKGIPNTNIYSDEELKDKIMLAFNEAELAIGTTINRTVRREKHPFDKDLYKAFIHIQSNFGPIQEIRDFSIVSSNEKNIFRIPASWIETSRFFQRQINVIPLTTVGATGVSSGQTTGAAGLVFIAAMNGGITWVPSYWQIEYVSGLCNKDGHIPVVVNEVIGIIAAIEILSTLASLNTKNSVSISHDGLSQSSSGPGPAVYQTRIGELNAKKNDLVNKIKKIFYNKYFLSNI
jgi:hypothetical protein